MNKFFKWLSGKPKDGDIVDCIKPILFIPQMLFATYLMYCGFTVDVIAAKFIFAMMAVVISWQAGWGMSVIRFVKNEKEIENEKI